MSTKPASSTIPTKPSMLTMPTIVTMIIVHARRHGRAFWGRARQITACAPQQEMCPSPSANCAPPKSYRPNATGGDFWAVPL